MFSFRFLPLGVLCAATFLTGRARAQATSATPPPPAGEKVERLDRYVVSSGPDAKTSFDLAQGTSVYAGDELRRIVHSTLGETLGAMPGVSSTSYGPGASRPLIRGLGGDRIRVLDNGVGALDASSISPDHNAAIEPLFASRIEVLRGPSTLLYGGSAVGGAINVIDNRIPETAPDRDFSGTLELRGGGSADERAAVLSTGGGNKDFAFHVNALKQKTDDLRIPGVARIDADAPATQPEGVLPNSATDTWSASLGATAFWSSGHAGAAVSRYETDYGVPTGDDPRTSIRMKQTRLDLSGELTQPFGGFRGAKGRLGFGNYSHSELSGGSQVNTTFKNQAAEGRLELRHAPIGRITGTIGVQGSRSDFSAVGEEVVTPPSLTENGAFFILEEVDLGTRTSLQAGARFEGQSVKLGEVDSTLPRLPGYAARSGQTKTFGGANASVGVVFRPAKDWSVGLALAYTERLPTAQELFSNGPHGGTGAYEVGSSGLAKEKSLGFDLSVRRRAGFVTGSVSAFVNRFSNFIFEQELAANAIPAVNNPDALTPFQFVAREAEFRGAEAEIIFHLVDENLRHVHLELMSDYVRAEQTADHEPIPRIPPLRFGVRLTYGDGSWNAGIEVRHAASQGRFTSGETSTPGYTLVNANVGYVFTPGRVSYEFFVKGENLTNAEARESTSFLKEFAPRPGHGLGAGVRVSF